MPLKKQLFGYNKEQVDDLMDQKDREIKSLNEQINKLKEDYEHLEKQKSLLQHRVNIQEQTNEEIARLALKEASELIDKAKKNANMILSESLEYVRSLSDEMSDFKGCKLLNLELRSKKCQKISLSLLTSQKFII